jgi:two-component system response regulator NreC
MANVRVLLADDHAIVRKGLSALLDGEPGFEAIAEVADGREALAKVEELQPDVVLMDISMPGLNGLEATRQIRQQFPEIKILILSMYATEEYIFQALQAGASGYVVKNSAVTDLIAAIRAIQDGDSYLSPSISKMVISEYIHNHATGNGGDRYDTLTSREREVLQLIAEGHSTREIAELLFISEKTVRAHGSALREKLDISSTARLTQYAIRKGLIAAEP